MASQASLLRVLTQQLQAICPIGGLAINDVNDPTSWRIDFDPLASPSQRAAATAFLTLGAVASAATSALLLDQIKTLENGFSLPLLAAAIAGDQTAIGKVTAAQTQIATLSTQATTAIGSPVPDVFV